MKKGHTHRDTDLQTKLKWPNHMEYVFEAIPSVTWQKNRFQIDFFKTTVFNLMFGMDRFWPVVVYLNICEARLIWLPACAHFSSGKANRGLVKGTQLNPSIVFNDERDYGVCSFFNATRKGKLRILVRFSWKSGVESVDGSAWKIVRRCRWRKLSEGSVVPKFEGKLFTFISYFLSLNDIN